MAMEYVPYDGQIVTLDYARKNGLLRYFTSKPCKRGHLSERLTSNRICMACAREKMARNKEYFVVKCKEWRKKNEERDNLNRKLYAERNRGRRTRQAYERQQKNLEKHKSYQKSWWKNNPARAIAYAAKGKARRLAADGEFSHEDVLRMLRAQNFKCVACDTSISHMFHVDHIVPLARGGSNWPDNLQLLCPPCNMSKGAKTMDEWLLKKGIGNG